MTTPSVPSLRDVQRWMKARIRPSGGGAAGAVRLNPQGGACAAVEAEAEPSAMSWCAGWMAPGLIVACKAAPA